MALQPLAPLQDLMPKAAIGTSGADIIEETQKAQVLQAQAQAQNQAAIASQAQAAQASAKAQQEQLAVQRKQAFYAALAEAGKDPSSEAYAAVAGNFPEESTGMKMRLDQLDIKEKKAFVGNALPAFNALSRGETGTGVRYLEQLARAHENKNRPEEAAQVRSWIDMIQKSGPYAANGVLGGMLSAAMGDKEFTGVVTAMDLPRKQRADEATTKSLELKAAAEGDTRGGLLAQGRSGVTQALSAAGASDAAAGASRVNARKTGIEADQLLAAGPSNLTTAQENALTATAGRKIKEAEAIVAEPMQKAALREAVAKADLLVSQAAVGPQLNAALAQQAETKAALARLELADYPLDAKLKREAIQIGSAKAVAKIRDIGNSARLAQEKLDLDRKEADDRRRIEWQKQRLAETELDPASRTRISGMITEASTARDTVRIAENLLLDLERDSSAAKLLGKTGEWIKGLAGYQGAETALRKNLNRLVMRDVLTQIPPGALSEAEQATIREGVPKAFDSDDVLKRYLNAAIKTARVEATIKEARAQWESRNSGNAAAATRPFSVMGIAVQPGETFEDAKKKWGRAQEIERKLQEGK